MDGAVYESDARREGRNGSERPFAGLLPLHLQAYVPPHQAGLCLRRWNPCPQASPRTASAKTPKLNCGNQIHALGTGNMNGCNYDFDGNGLSMEVSAIYLAMKNSKLECVDEHVVPTFRRLLLPKQTRSCPSITLVLDLDAVLASLPPSMQLDLLVQVV
ncbi:unnamed protein product [Sphenostylis stenocarpa]|uniref:Uncharacterized protein n=1 Tax=Sphenostylis stenocarpa TaxID=92480 RepID=A0AA86STI8_9FABA|nr:unnamed protein product [Sphenostylis stenocarpa]